MTNNEYHSLPAVGSTSLNLILNKTPLHFWERNVNPGRAPTQPTKAMQIGTAFHAAIFEPETFKFLFAAEPEISKASTVGKLVYEYLDSPSDFIGKYVGIPDGLSKTSKEGKALREGIALTGKVAHEHAVLIEVYEHASGLEGRALLGVDDLTAVQKMAAAARKNHALTDLMSTGVAEYSMFFIDEDTNIDCKIRPDWHSAPIGDYAGSIIDGKSTIDASPVEFGKSIWNYGMPLQAAFYVDGFMEFYGVDVEPDFYWFAQEKTAPWCNKIYKATPLMIEFGRVQYKKALEILKECRDSGVWPAYGDKIEDATLPYWALKQVDDEMGEGEMEISYDE